ncbi:hypothetical protein [Methanosarcina sp. Kolksee]|uniref:hypothetical protein n=1 Tax=Methanosarcina sp. Kolksee TaxID=1434099 RepID=UPI00064EA997|nr:hypothetical protein [Methanosarcina sp. Kolksee]
MNNQIIIESSTITLKDLKQHLEENIKNGIHLEIRESRVKERNIPQEVLIAAIGTSGTILGVLITSLFQYVSAKRNEIIVVEVGDVRIEVPANVSEEKLDRLIQLVKSAKETRIIVR